MARRNYDPWSKKSKKGMKLLNSVIKGTYKVGKAASKSSKKKVVKTSNSNGYMLTLSIFIFGITLLLFIKLL